MDEVPLTPPGYGHPPTRGPGQPPPPAANQPATSPLPPAPGHPELVHAGDTSGRGWSRWKIALLIGLIVFTLVCGFALLGATYLYSNAESVNENVPFEARVGDCFGNDGSQQPVPCTKDPWYEVYSAVEFFRSADYPSGWRRSLGATGVQICEDDLELYSGRGYFDFSSTFDYHVILPSEQAWADGERRALCVAYDTESRPLQPRYGR